MLVTHFEPLQYEGLQGTESKVPDYHKPKVGDLTLIFDSEVPHGEHGEQVHHGEVVLEGVALQEAEDEHREEQLLLVDMEREQEEVDGDQEKGQEEVPRGIFAREEHA